jgi:heme exporter protein A
LPQYRRLGLIFRINREKNRPGIASLEMARSRACAGWCLPPPVAIPGLTDGNATPSDATALFPQMANFEGRSLHCRRGGRDVFAELSFALPAGGALLLTGPNGSGKSSLLRLMAGLLKPAAGALLWGGVPIAEEPETHAARLHYLGHLDAVKPVLTVTENLRFWADLRGGAVALEAALESFALTELAAVPGRLLSAGQRRRVALARLVAVPADLWLLDEPSVGLDHASVGRLAAAIASHRAGGGRVVVATHTALDLAEPMRLSLDSLAPPPLPEMVW